MVNDPGTQQERRHFFRINFHTPLRFKIYASDQEAPKEASKGISQNISPAGILFQTENRPPQLSSILWMSLDIRTLKICQEIEQRALIFKSGLLGRVVRVEEDSDSNSYDVGVCFLTKTEQSSREVQQILSEVSQES